MSRYLRLRAEQVSRTLWVGGGVVVVVGVGVGSFDGVCCCWRRVAIAVSRSRISQSQRSASVRGSPRAILATLVGVWYWWVGWLVLVVCVLMFCGVLNW